jgi:membrane protein YqaA with SNARE-associated domain
MKDKFIKWSEKVANSKHALKTLFWVSFAESCISPFPAYFLVLFILAHKVKHSWKKVATVATISSVLGGILGYIIGFYFFKYLGQPILDFYHLQNDFNAFGDKLHNNEFWILLVAAMTPIPYKITAIASGLFAVNFPLFMLTSVLGRGIKFFIISFLTSKYGVKMKESMQNNLWTSIITFLVICALVYYFVFR